MLTKLSVAPARRLAGRIARRDAPVAALSTAQSPQPQLPPTGAFIGNEWVNGQSTFQTFDPATKKPIADVTDATREEVDRAFEAAYSAFYGGEWSKLSGYERGRLMNKLADLIEENRENLAMLETLDNGKPIGESRDLDLELVLQCLRYFAGWADKINGSVTNPGGPIAKNLFGYIEKEPVGVVAQIIPWNFPMLMMAWKLGPALATGCSVVMKTAPQTPLTANAIAELIKQAGFPAGAVNVLPGGDVAGRHLVQHPGFDKIAFTGSTAVGYEIMQAAASSEKMKRVTLELGGKSPVIICPDADMEKAIGASHLGLFLNQGQCCCAGSRIYVHESVYDEYVEKATKLASERVNLPGYSEQAMKCPAFSNITGPQINQEQVDKIIGLIESGKKEGATLMTGGGVGSDNGFFVQPTVFADVKDDMAIAREEIFGPVMSIMRYSDEDEAIRRANDSCYGLAASVFSNSFPTSRRIASQLRSGSVWINTYDAFDASLPFGGFKASGQGRENGEAGLLPYLENKTIVVGM